mgnify:CR=1 FL=1
MKKKSVPTLTWSQRLRDPALTQFQIRYALVCNATGYILLGQARGITPVILSMILMFGIFGMSKRQLAANMVFALVLFGAAIGIVAWLDEPGCMPGLEAANAVMIMLVLLGSTFIAIRLQEIRKRLTQQKLALTRAVEQIRHLATHDELTGLVNRRRMTELMEAEWQRCERNGRPLILALLDLDLFKHHAEPLDLPELQGHARPYALFVGRVSYEKNIDAFLDMPWKGTRIVCGEGPLADSLKARYPGVVWMGVLPRPQLAQVYAAADVFVFPSRNETFGLVMLEAMACGTPVAAYPVDGPLQVMGADQGQTTGGVLAEDLAEATFQALQLPRQEARLRSEVFAWPHAVALFRSFLTPIKVEGKP